MSLLNRNRYRKKLQELLARASDEAFFQMVWAIDALQSGRETLAARHIQFPAAAATSDLNSKLAIHKWDLETLIVQLLNAEMHGARRTAALNQLQFVRGRCCRRELFARVGKRGIQHLSEAL
jgi:hypothetical protein